MKIQLGILALLLFAAGSPGPVSSQAGPDLDERIAAQREAMERLAFMDGSWTGGALIKTGAGETRSITQTERVGPLLGGTIKLIEGRGYEADGTLSFNAFAVISYDVDRDAYTMRSYAFGHSGDYAFTPGKDGFTWEIPAGETTIRFSAEFEDGSWRQTGEYVLPGGEAFRYFEMDLERVGDADWLAE